jgi:hypothetical protein
MFIDWLQHHDISTLRPVTENAGEGSAKVFDIPELAGMTAASLLEAFFKEKNIDHEFVTASKEVKLDYEIQKWVTHRLMEVTSAENSQQRGVTYPEAQLLFQALTTYMTMYKTTPPIFSRIMPVEKLERPANN